MAELFDLYDAAGQPLGQRKPRELVHRDGDWHRSAHIWIFNSAGRLLFQRRSATKDTWPCRLDASIGGHYRAGESVMDTVKREAREELGVDVIPSTLIPLGIRAIESIEPTIIDREWQDIFLLYRNTDLFSYRPDHEEIDAITFLMADDDTPSRQPKEQHTK